MNTKTVISGCLGAMFGQACGDALGSQTEFDKHRVSELGNTWGYNFPAFSDDTQMSLAIAEGLIESGIVPEAKFFTNGDLPPGNVEELMTMIAANFIKWQNGDPRWGNNDRSPGGTCSGAVRRIKTEGISKWWSTGARDSGKGNGGAMRSSTVGIYFHSYPVAAFQIGALSSVPTHNNLESCLASSAVSFLVASSITGMSFPQSLTLLFEMMGKYKTLLLHLPDAQDQSGEFAIGRLASAVTAAMTGTSVKEFHRFNGNDGKGVEAVAAAIHANLLFNSYREVVTALANDTGDSDSTAAIGGAIAGARFGVENIPDRWVKDVEKADYLRGVAERLYKTATEPRVTAELEPLGMSEPEPAIDTNPADTTQNKA